MSPLSSACRKDGILAAAAIAMAGFDSPAVPAALTFAPLTAVVFSPLFALFMFSKGMDGVAKFEIDLENVVVVIGDGC